MILSSRSLWQWGLWIAVVVAAFISIGVVRHQPVEIAPNMIRETLICNPITTDKVGASFWPYSQEIADWARAANATSTEHYLQAVTGALDACNGARQNKMFDITLAAIVWGVAVVILCPRKLPWTTGRTPKRDETTDEEIPVHPAQ